MKIETELMDDTFTMPKKKVIRLEMKKILERLIQDDNSNKNVGVFQQKTTYYTINTKKEKDFDEVLKKEN